MTSAPFTRAIHALRREAGIGDADYRALLDGMFGVPSSTCLDDGQAGELLDQLKKLAGATQGAAFGRPKAATARGRYASVLQALWLSAFNLGLVRNRDDRAMIEFVRRQTGLAHVAFLSQAEHARAAIEALKGWISRETGLDWPTEAQARERGTSRAFLSKRAVCKAIALRLHAAGGFEAFGPPGAKPWPVDFEAYGYKRGLPAAFTFYSEQDWDRLSNWLGGRLRATLAKAREARDRAAGDQTQTTGDAA